MFSIKQLVLGLVIFSGCASFVGQSSDGSAKYDVKSAFNSVVKISMVVDSPEVGKGEISGSAWAIDEDNLITASHVCEAFIEFRSMGAGKDMKITYFDGVGLDVRLANDMLIVVSDVANDVCLIRYEDHGLVPLKPASKVEFGEAVYIIGAPMGFLGFIFDGRVVYTDYDLGEKYKHKVVVSAASTGGNSGGPIINQDGEVIGMLIAGAGSFDHFSIGTGLAAIRQIVRLLSI